jgi:hypothetical protein
MASVTFYNVTITYDVEGNGSLVAKEAYRKLCEALSTLDRVGAHVEWETDIYSINNGEHRSTEELRRR